MAARRLRAFVRVREAVAASAEPQLQRGQDDDEEEVTEALPARDAEGNIIPRAKATKKAKKSGGKAKPARESTRFRVELRETDVRKSGGAYEATVLREGPGNPEDKNAYSREALREAVGSGLFEACSATPTIRRRRRSATVPSGTSVSSWATSGRRTTSRRAAWGRSRRDSCRSPGRATSG
jgi:hypothetical protein